MRPYFRYKYFSFDKVYRDRYFKQAYFDGIDHIINRLAEIYPENTPTIGKSLKIEIKLGFFG